MLVPFLVSAQISGVVRDPAGEPLAFVSVIPNNQHNKVAISDINGRFQFPEMLSADSLVFHYVGFERLVLFPENGRFVGTLTVVLKPRDYDLSEALILPKENPAHALIRKAIERRRANNPERGYAYICNTYNKVTVDVLPNRAEFDKKMGKKDPDNPQTAKAIERFAQMERGTKEHHILFMETVTERKYRPLGQSQERVLLNQVSGFKDMGLVAIANAVQPFSFYEDAIRVLDRDYVNPISPGSIERYFFQIEDTLYDPLDTIWVISFRPRKGKVFNALKGVLHLHRYQWAIQNVRAEPAWPFGNISMKIEQSYRVEENDLPGAGGLQWFPDQLNFELITPRYPDPTAGMRVSGKSFISGVRFTEGLRDRDFLPETPIFMDKGATESPDSAWAVWRNASPLSRREARTYRWLDSLVEKENIGVFTKLINYSVTGRAYLRYGISLDLGRIIAFNQYENTRLGLGIGNAESRPLRLPRRVEWNAWAGYGFQDKAWKYGGSLQWRIHRARNTFARFVWQREVLEPGAAYELPRSAVFNRRLYANRMDITREMLFTVGGKLWRGARMELGIRRQEIRPDYLYRFGRADGPLSSRFTFAEANVFFRYAAGEEPGSFLRDPANAMQKFPVLEAGYTHSIAALGNQYEYTRWTLAVYQQCYVRRLGALRWRAEAGLMRGEAPISKMFTLNQSGNSGNNWLIWVVPNTFQALPDTVYLSDRFVNVYLSQNLGPVWYQRKASAPELIFHQNIALGDLRDPGLHQRIGFATPKRALLETGLQIDNIYRFNYLNIGYFGLGLAGFYRWGGLDTGKWQKNIVPRLSLRLRFG